VEKMMYFFPHPTDPNLVVLKTTPRYIGKHSDEDLKAAVLAEREACARLCDDWGDFGGIELAMQIRQRNKNETNK
jgi:hypothetical protein